MNAVPALVFAASAAVTVIWCGSMSGMPGMEMPGGWTMSMAWMRMPGQSWFGAAATFTGMWSVMMVAMMLPVLMPMLPRRGLAGALLVAGGYFAVWTLLGVVAYPVGVLLAEIAMQVPAVAQAVPALTGLVLVIAGAMQFSAWKRRQLQCCRETVGCRKSPATGHQAWRVGLRAGLQCIRCCAGPTAVLLVIGVMDLRAMALVMSAVALERLHPKGEWLARMTGGICVAAGLVQMAGS